MRFLSVAERELRGAARRSRTYFVRWITGCAFLGLLIWLFWVLDGFRNRNAAPEVFQILSVFTFFYALFIGAAVTADCISAEKREGTLGLLFLTNLNSLEIILGKLCSSALVTVYGLFSVFPMLALLVMCGGVTLDLFWQTVLALVNAIFFAVTAGFVASVLCVRQFTAVAMAIGLALVFGAGLLGAAAVMDSVRGARIWVDTLSFLCPLYGLITAGGSRVFSQNHYWLSLALSMGFSLFGLVMATSLLARTWQDRPKRSRMPIQGSLSERRRLWSATGRARLRRRLLDRNPFFWLGSRQIISAPVFMCLTVLLVMLTLYVTTPYLERLFRAGSGGMEALACAWLWLGIGLHALVFYYAAMIASQRVAEDKQTGAFELILSTPVKEQLISRGFWLAYWRRLFFPALAAVLVHLAFIWLGATFLIFEVDEVPLSMTPGQLIWRALLKLPVSGEPEDWNFWLAIRIFLLALILVVGVWFTLGWVGRWLGLWMKHPGFAPLVALALISVPPVLVFSIICFVAEELNFFRMPERVGVPIMMWTAFGIGALHCLVLSRWAAVRLRRDLRAIVIGQFKLPRPRFWWLPSRRTVVRHIAWATGVVVTATLLVVGFYVYQDWRSRRNWTEFQRALTQKGATLDITPLMPTPVSDDLNLARAAAFLRFSNDTATKRLLDRLQRWESIGARYGNVGTYEWIAQRHAPLAEHLGIVWDKIPAGLKTNRLEVAPVILEGLQTHQEVLRDISVSARLPHFQVSTGRQAMAVMQSDPAAISTLNRLHFLFCVRACALLAANQNQDAGEDVLTSIHLARLARQPSDTASATRVQEMLVRSFQPLWEGLAEHQWNEAQLAAFQNELVKFNPMADFTNTVRRIVLAHIEIWRAYPDAKVQPRSVPIGGNSYLGIENAWFRPPAWWLDDCIQLHQVGEQTVAQVDAARQVIRRPNNWNETRGLSLGHETEQFLGQNRWWWPTTPALLAFAQNALNQAVIACALERHYLAKGTYPESLNQLVPAYLDRIPADIIRGRPMIYQRTDDGFYIIRSVGPNGQDDRRSKSADDWLWWYGTNAPMRTPQATNQ